MAGYLIPVAEALPELSRSFDLSLFVFDRCADPRVIAISTDYDTYVWSPMSMRFEDYCQLLAQQDMIVTSRAHGAMCAAILGIPSLIIEIEPKLRTIHDILPNSTRLVTLDASVLSTWLPALDDLFSINKTIVAADVEHNRILISKAVNESLDGY